MLDMPAAPTLEALLRKGAAALRDAGIEDARREARLLAGAALAMAPENLISARETVVDTPGSAAFEAMIARRAEGEPVSRILGRRGFWTLDLAIGPAVLDPRADTETLVEFALRLCDSRQPEMRILDLGTGSGCLLLALLDEMPEAWGIGIDRSPDAAGVARANASACGLAERAQIICADWSAPLDGRFDLVVSNPPYIPSGDIAGLDREVAAFDPRLALDGGDDGLHCYRAITPRLPALLVPGGWALFEVGAGQSEAVSAMMAEAGLCDIRTASDLGGHLRCVAGRAGKAKKPLDRAA